MAYLKKAAENFAVYNYKTLLKGEQTDAPKGTRRKRKSKMDQSRHGEGLTSVKVHHRPGGNTSIDLFGGYGGDDGAKDRQRQPAAAAAVNPIAEEEKKEEQPNATGAAAATNNVEAAFDVYGNKVGGTSVRVHAPPGGKSSITF